MATIRKRWVYPVVWPDGKEWINQATLDMDLEQDEHIIFVDWIPGPSKPTGAFVTTVIDKTERGK